MKARRVDPTALCPLTGHEARPYARKGGAEYFRDPHSGIIFLVEPPKLEHVSAFVDAEYESGVYREYVNARDLKLATFRRRLPVIDASARGRRLLDVGSGAGFFIEAAVEAGFDATGIELSPVAIRLAPPSIRDRIAQGDVNSLLATDTRRFDVVTAFDIVEHTFNPAAFLDDIWKLLADDGLLAVTTPDTGHWLRRPMKSRWPMLQPDQHTYLFSRRAMRDLLVDRGYKPILIETAKKVLTADYLFGQLRQTNPTLAAFLELAKRLLPSAARYREVGVNIGEMLVLARKHHPA